MKINQEITKIFLIAGENSGDILAGKLMIELKQIFVNAKFYGVGGKNMIDQGLESIFAMEELAVMGFVEVVPHLFTLIKRINQTADFINQLQPQIVITIDSPDFCFRVVKKIQKLKNCKKVHLIAPSVWAYREGRAKKIAKLYNLLLAILPFEPPYFEKYHLKTVFVGHPIIESAPNFNEKKLLRNQFRSNYQIGDDDFVICLTPGSRNNEVIKIFPEFILAINLLAKQKPNIKIVIPVVKKTEELVKKMANKLNVNYFLIPQDQKNQMMFACDFAIAKSGTNSIEFSLYQIPIVIGYKINILTYIIVKSMIKIKFANLINLILNREVIPEFLQYDCNGQKIYTKILELIDYPKIAQQQTQECLTALKLLGLNNEVSASKKSANLIYNLFCDV